MKSLKLAACGAALTTIVSAFACGETAQQKEQPERAGSVGQAETTSATLISASTCTLRSGRLVSCQIGPQTLTGKDLETAVPLRTVLTATRNGNCSTRYPLQVSLDTPGEQTVVFSYLSQAAATVRRRDGAPIPYILLKDSSPWTANAVFDASCEITLSIVSNQPDVDSKDQALAIVARLQADLDAKTKVRDRLGDLVNYQKAFQFLQSVTNSFYAELTSDAMQLLRGDGQAARPVLMKLLSDNTCSGKLTDDELSSMVSLYQSLAVLGSPNDWRNPDGGTKTIADFLGPEAAAVLAAVQKLSQLHNDDAGTGYTAEYQQAAQDVERAKVKLALAKAQLATWLSM